MSKPGSSQPECPVGETSCEWLDEVDKLRYQVSELSELVSTDALTGLFNFRHFRTEVEQAGKRIGGDQLG